LSDDGRRLAIQAKGGLKERKIIGLLMKMSDIDFSQTPNGLWGSFDETLSRVEFTTAVNIAYSFFFPCITFTQLFTDP